MAGPSWKLYGGTTAAPRRLQVTSLTYCEVARITESIDLTNPTLSERAMKIIHTRRERRSIDHVKRTVS
ncbi:MAG: hypothetical protein ACETWE_03325 [Candidatus Bathyarchaeia archaeon]